MTTEANFDGHIRQLLSIFQRRWKMILAASLIGAVAIASLPLLLGPRYTAKAQIVIDPQRAAGSEGSAIMSAMLDTAAIESHVAILTSESQLLQLLVDLNQNSGSEQTNRTSARAPDFRGLDIVKLSRGFNAFKERQSRVIGVTYTAADPNLAAAVVNRAVNLYLTSQVTRNLANKGETLKVLQQRIPQAKSELDRAESAVENYRLVHANGPQKNNDAVDRQITELNRELSEARTELLRSEARLASLKDLPKSNPTQVSGADELEDQRNGELSREHAAQGSALPRDNLARNDPSEGNDQKPTVLAQRSRDATADRDGALNRVADILQRLGTLHEARTRFQGPEVQLQELQREANAYRRLYDDLLLRQKATLEESEVRVLSLASTPSEPSSPRPILFALPGFILAGIAASLIAVLLEQLDRGLRTEQDISDALKLRCVGVIPMLGAGHTSSINTWLSSSSAYLSACISGFRFPGRPLGGGHYASLNETFAPNELTTAAEQSAYTEAMISAVVSTLEMAHSQAAPRIVLVTSSLPGEGKSSFAAGFVATAVELKRRVLLVGLDFTTVGAPSLPPTSSLTRTSGDETQALAACITRSPDHDYDYLPLADALGEPIAILRDNQVAKLLQQLRERYDLIVIDGASILGASETRVLARLADKVLLVVKWGSTSREIVQNALGLLQATSDRKEQVRRADVPIAAVISQVDLQRHALYQQGALGDSLKYARRRAAA